MYNHHNLSDWVYSELPQSVDFSSTVTHYNFCFLSVPGQWPNCTSLIYPKLIKSLILHPQFSHSRCPFGSEAENSVWKQCWLFWKNNCLHIGYPGGKGFVMFWEKDKEEVWRGGNANQLSSPSSLLSPLDVEFISTYSQEKHKLMLLLISFPLFLQRLWIIFTSSQHTWTTRL